MTQKPSVQTFSRNCCWDAPKNSEERLGPCWSDVWFQDSVFTDERSMNKNENKQTKIFLRAIQLSYIKWFWCVWLVSIPDHQAFASYNSPTKKIIICLLPPQYSPERPMRPVKTIVVSEKDSWHFLKQPGMRVKATTKLQGDQNYTPGLQVGCQDLVYSSVFVWTKILKESSLGHL